MAEARLAVHPQPTVARGGFEVDTSMKHLQCNFSDAGIVLYLPHPRFVLRNVRRALWRAVHMVQMAYMPFSSWFVLGVLSGVSAWVTQSSSNSWQRSGTVADLLWKLDSLSPISQRLPTTWRVAYLAFNFSATVMLAITSVQRCVLRQLLAYHGWLFESQAKKKSLKTTVWGLILKYVYIRRIAKNLYAYQSALPTLPLPSLQQTTSRYIETVRPLLSTEEFNDVQGKMQSFLKNEGPRLQNWLRLKWWTSNNYVSDWWLNFVYLRGRDSLCINSNWYGVMYADYFPTHSVAARAASAVFNLVNVKCKLDDESFEPLNIGGSVPLCMAQYEYVFSTTRVPGAEQDNLVKADPSESRHIVVLHKGRFYKMNVFSPKCSTQLTPLQLCAAFNGILGARDQTDPAEALLPALTCINRTEWAELRERYFLRDLYNRHLLEVLEKALFFVSLDDEAAPKTLTEESRMYLMGNGHNRWADKSFNLVITSNAKCGCHVEHSWGDAPILAHITEYCSCSEEQREHYHADGTIKATPEDITNQKANAFHMFPAERMRFHISEGLAEAAEHANTNYCKQIADLDLLVDRFCEYGKGFVKKYGKVSPDAWIQLAMQIAYFRDQGRFDQTYESSMTRLFFAGRTETIRSASNESCAFVRAFEKSDVPREDKIKLLVDAANHHQEYSHLAMTGGGVDRHLFALYVVSVGKSIESPFLNSALSRKWKLSTSQVPTRQCSPGMHDPDVDKFHTPFGGFGPVADDGYGVSYCIWGEQMFYFNVSSKVSAPNTNSKRFHERICQALHDMGVLVKG